MNSQVFFSCFPSVEFFTEHNKSVNCGKGYSFTIQDGTFLWSYDTETYSNSFVFPEVDRRYMVETYSKFFYDRMRFLHSKIKEESKPTSIPLYTFNDLQRNCRHYFSDDTMRWFNCRVSDGNVRNISKLGITLVMLSNKNHSVIGNDYDREYKIISVDHVYDEKLGHQINNIQPHDTGLSYKQTKRRFEKLVQNAHQGIIPQICD